MPFPRPLLRCGLRSLANRLPSQCAVCRGWGPSRLCRACVARFASPAARCTACGLQVPSAVARCGACLRHPPPFDITVAATDYAFPWDRLLLAFKFHDALDLADALAGRLAAAVQQAGHPPPDLLLPVPSGPGRLRTRGFNPAWEIARRLPLAPGARADARLLLRQADTPHQLALPKDRRAANVRGAFTVEPLRRHELAGRHVAVIDDVMTTAATVGEVATVLRRAGASTVQVWVVARARRPG